MGVCLVTLSLSASSTLRMTTKNVKLEDGKKEEIEAAKLPEKITKNVAEANKGKEYKISKAFQLKDAAGAVVRYEVVVLSGNKEEVFKFDKNGDMIKEVITPASTNTATPAGKAEEKK